MKLLPADFAISIHPGEVLAEILEEKNISQSFLAKHLGMDPGKINEICRGRRGISATMAVALSKALKVSANTWLNLQKNWELSQVDNNYGKDIIEIKVRV